MSILSIQSHVAFGHVGNAAAVFPLQRLGFEVWPIMTVQFSNHTGYGAWRGQVFSPEHIGELIDGIEERGQLGQCEAVLSGYMGDAALGQRVFDAVQRVRRLNPGAIYACDPVMGDVGRGIFVRPGIPELMRDEAVKHAHIMTPNQFELELLTGHEVKTVADGVEAARALIAMGPRVVLLTSLRAEDSSDTEIEMLAVTNEEALRIATPYVPFDPPPNGTGDAVTALFLGHYLKSGGSLATALEGATAGIFTIIEATRTAGTRELQLVAAQDGLAHPPGRFRAQAV